MTYKKREKQINNCNVEINLKLNNNESSKSKFSHFTRRVRRIWPSPNWMKFWKKTRQNRYNIHLKVKRRFWRILYGQIRETFPPQDVLYINMCCSLEVVGDSIKKLHKVDKSQHKKSTFWVNHQVLLLYLAGKVIKLKRKTQSGALGPRHLGVLLTNESYLILECHNLIIRNFLSLNVHQRS